MVVVVARWPGSPTGGAFPPAEGCVVPGATASAGAAGAWVVGTVPPPLSTGAGAATSVPSAATVVGVVSPVAAVVGVVWGVVSAVGVPSAAGSTVWPPGPLVGLVVPLSAGGGAEPPPTVVGVAPPATVVAGVSVPVPPTSVRTSALLSRSATLARPASTSPRRPPR